MPKVVPLLQGVPRIGHFSHVVEAAGLVFLSGQTGEDRTSGEIVTGGIREQCRQLLDNAGHLLGQVGLTYDDVVKVTVYLVDLDERKDMNEVYRERFPVDPPARVTIGVANLGRTARVEMDFVAAR
jgi:2-iminobutanoate/2-iminopropanoate deaminase